MNLLSGALPVPYVPVRVTRGALLAHLYIYALPRSSLPQNFCSLLSVPLERSCWPPFDGVGLEGYKGRANAFLLVLP